MTAFSIQDRTSEFQSILSQARKRQTSSKGGSQRQSLLTETQRQEANGSPTGVKGAKAKRSEFARGAAEVGRGISATMGKLERLTQCTSALDLINL